MGNVQNSSNHHHMANNGNKSSKRSFIGLNVGNQRRNPSYAESSTESQHQQQPQMAVNHQKPPRPHVPAPKFNKATNLPKAEKRQLPTQHGDVEATRMRLLSCGESHEHRSEQEIVLMVSMCIAERVSANDMLLGDQIPTDIFCGSCQPKITVEDYVRRIVHYLTGLAEYEKKTGHDEEVRSDLALRYIVMSLIYLQKINSVPGFVVCSRNIHRLLITAIMLAAKVVDDIQPKNSYFAQLGGIPVEEINELESTFCSLLQFKLFISSTEFDYYYEQILTQPTHLTEQQQAASAA